MPDNCAGGALALAGIRSENTRARRMLACGLYRASRDQPERAPRILVERRHCPLLVIQGLDDEAAPPGNGHALRDQLGARVRLVDLPDAGHFLLLEQPDAVARAVSEFLGVEGSGLMTPH